MKRDKLKSYKYLLFKKIFSEPVIESAKNAKSTFHYNRTN